VLIRFDEYRKRPEYINKTVEEIINFQKKADALGKDHKWLNETDLAPLNEIINETIDWIKDLIKR
jgi:hypothetical protein